MAKKTDFVQDIWDTFIFSYTAMEDDITRLKSLQDTYDNKVDESMWSTQSQIPLPLAWAAVETATGPALDYLFPPMPSTKLVPTKEMDTNALENIEWALHLMLNNRMNLKHEMSRSIKDCYKCGVGYGIIEPVVTTPPAVFEITVKGNKTKQMRVGSPVVGISYRYISPGKIVPYPSGVDFNGNDSTPYAFFLDLYDEFAFRNMYETQPRDGSDVMLKGNPDDIIAEARDKGFTSETGIIEFINKMGGRESLGGGTKATGNVPVRIPVLKCYMANRHVWIFAGAEKTAIYDVEGTFETMRKPLIKFDAFMDGDRWFPMSQAEADERTTWSKNVLFNAVFDLINENTNRPLLYNSDLNEEPPDFGANGVAGVAVGTSGDVNKAVSFMSPPNVDQGTFMMLDQIDKIHSDITGQRDFTGKNFTRGGSQAFTDLLNTSNGRDKLRYALLQTGGYESVVRQVLLYMQKFGSELDLDFRKPAYNQKDAKDYIEYFSITENDLRHNFDVVIDLESKQRRGASEIAGKLAIYDRKKDNPFFDQWQISRDLCEDEYEAQRQVKSREEVQKLEEEQRNAKLAQMQGGMPTPQGEATDQMDQTVQTGNEVAQ